MSSHAIGATGTRPIRQWPVALGKMALSAQADRRYQQVEAFGAVDDPAAQREPRRDGDGQQAGGKYKAANRDIHVRLPTGCSG